MVANLWKCKLFETHRSYFHHSFWKSLKYIENLFKVALEFSREKWPKLLFLRRCILYSNLRIGLQWTLPNVSNASKEQSIREFMDVSSLTSGQELILELSSQPLYKPTFIAAHPKSQNLRHIVRQQYLKNYFKKSQFSITIQNFRHLFRTQRTHI